MTGSSVTAGLHFSDVAIIVIFPFLFSSSSSFLQESHYIETIVQVRFTRVVTGLPMACP